MLLAGPVRFYHGRQLLPREFVQLGKDDSGMRVINYGIRECGCISDQYRAEV